MEMPDARIDAAPVVARRPVGAAQVEVAGTAEEGLDLGDVEPAVRCLATDRLADLDRLVAEQVEQTGARFPGSAEPIELGFGWNAPERIARLALFFVIDCAEDAVEPAHRRAPGAWAPLIDGRTKPTGAPSAEFCVTVKSRCRRVAPRPATLRNAAVRQRQRSRAPSEECSIGATGRMAARRPWLRRGCDGRPDAGKAKREGSVINGGQRCL
jgi:choline dehydrogenase-like flavoprotein